MTMVSRLLAGLLPLLVAAWFVAPVQANGWLTETDTVHVSANIAVPALRQVDHSSKRPRERASLEEFFEFDDDAEQYFQWQAIVHPGLFAGTALVSQSKHHFYDVPLPKPWLSAAYPTGPPYA